MVMNHHSYFGLTDQFGDVTIIAMATITSSVAAGVFLDPPTNSVAQHTTPLLIGAIIFALLSAIVGVIYTMRTRSPLYFWTAVAGYTLYPFVVEPLADWFVAAWYPTNHLVALTVADRPMALFGVFFYGAGIPLCSVAAYEIIRRGLPAKVLLLLVGVVTVLELPLEMLGSHFCWIIYYGNYAVLLGVPIYSLVQNGGMFALIAWVLGWLMPHVRGWRWMLVPLAVAAALPAFAVVTSWPAYLAIALHAGPVVGWSAGAIATALNLAVVIWCVYSPTLERYRADAGAARAIATAPAAVA
ncbi:MAG: hypothetical protein AB1925_00560 [Actinomycetota bacterium]|jgi:hypothetical protein